MCRTANGFDINFEEVYRKNIHSVIATGELYCDTLLSGAQKDGRGNIAPSTIIMPTLAMQALDEDELAFVRDFEEKHNAVVYYILESDMFWGRILSDF